MDIEFFRLIYPEKNRTTMSYEAFVESVLEQECRVNKGPSTTLIDESIKNKRIDHGYLQSALKFYKRNHPTDRPEKNIDETFIKKAQEIIQKRAGTALERRPVSGGLLALLGLAAGGAGGYYAAAAIVGAAGLGALFAPLAIVVGVFLGVAIAKAVISVVENRTRIEISITDALSKSNSSADQENIVSPSLSHITAHQGSSPTERSPNIPPPQEEENENKQPPHI